MTRFDSPAIRIGGEGLTFGNPAFAIGEKVPAFGTGGGDFYVNDLGRPLSFYVDDLGRPLSFYLDDQGRRL